MNEKKLKVIERVLKNSGRCLYQSEDNGILQILGDDIVIVFSDITVTQEERLYLEAKGVRFCNSEEYRAINIQNYTNNKIIHYMLDEKVYNNCLHILKNIKKNVNVENRNKLSHIGIYDNSTIFVTDRHRAFISWEYTRYMELKNRVFNKDFFCFSSQFIVKNKPEFKNFLDVKIEVYQSGTEQFQKTTLWIDGYYAEVYEHEKIDFIMPDIFEVMPSRDWFSEYDTRAVESGAEVKTVRVSQRITAYASELLEILGGLKKYAVLDKKNEKVTFNFKSRNVSTGVGDVKKEVSFSSINGKSAIPDYQFFDADFCDTITLNYTKLTEALKVFVKRNGIVWYNRGKHKIQYFVEYNTGIYLLMPITEY